MGTHPQGNDIPVYHLLGKAAVVDDSPLPEPIELTEEAEVLSEQESRMADEQAALDFEQLKNIGDAGYLAKNKLKRLWPHHLRMAQMCACGMTNSNIAAITGFSTVQITNIQASPCFQTEVARLLGDSEDVVRDVKQELIDMAVKAVAVLDEDLEMPVGNNPAMRRIRQGAAVTVLDKIGMTKNNPQGFPTHLHLHKHNQEEVKDRRTEDLQNDVMDLILHED